MDVKTGVHEFAVRTEGILPRICGLHSFIKWNETFAAGFVIESNFQKNK